MQKTHGRLPKDCDFAGRALCGNCDNLRGCRFFLFCRGLKEITLTGGGGSGERHFSRLTTWEEELAANRIETAMGGGVCCPEFY